MSRTAAAPSSITGVLRFSVVGLAFLAAAVLGSLVHQTPSPPPPSLGGIPRADLARTTPDALGADTRDDGKLPDGVTLSEDEYAGVANLEPDLLQALRDAARDAANDGIELQVKTGWRSAEYQDRLLGEAVVEYRSMEEAARWVATAETSPHVSGDAVDVGPFAAMAWLSEHGAEYGLCQIYRNEPWHYELRPGAIDRRCPRMYADPTHDPRMQ